MEVKNLKNEMFHSYEKFIRNREGVVTEEVLRIHFFKSGADSIRNLPKEIREMTTDKEWLYRTTTESDEMYKRSTIDFFHHVGAFNGYTLKKRYSQRGDQYEHCKINRAGDTIEYILLDSTFLYPKRHYLLFKGKEYNLLKVHKRLKNGLQRMTLRTPGRKVLIRSFLKRTDGEDLWAQSHSRERIISVARIEAGVEKKLGGLDYGDRLYSLRHLRKTHLDWEKMSNWAVYSIQYCADTLKMSKRLYSSGKGEDLHTIGERTVFKRELKRRIQIDGETIFLSDWYISREMTYGSHGLTSRYELEPDAIKSIDVFKERLAAGRDHYLYQLSKRMYNQKGELVRGVSTSSFQKIVLACEYMADSNLLIMKNYVWFNPLEADSVLTYDVKSWDASFSNGSRKGRIKTEYERTGEVKNIETRILTYDALGRFTRLDGIENRDSRTGTEKKTMDRVLKQTKSGTFWTEKSSRTIVYRVDAEPSISVSYKEYEYGPDGNLLSYSDGWIEGGERRESDRIEYKYLQSGLLIRVDYYDDGELERVTHCTYEYGHQ